MKKNNKKFFIEALEQRIMLDGAGASTFIDTLEDTAHNKFSLNNESKVNKFVESANKDSDVKLPFINQTRDQKRNELRQIVFIDTQVEDYQQLIRAFDKNTEIHLIQSNENGFDKINQTLKGYKNIDSLHIIGHGSAGQILFGDALLSNDTFNQYSKTLKSIGNNLSPSGDILFYGCNIASNERGLSLISKISEITKADIAASDDVTGKSGDWKLESKFGNIETKNINQTDYQHDLVMYKTESNLAGNAFTSAGEVTVGADGITSIRGAMAAFTGTADRNAFDFKSSRDHNPGGGPGNNAIWRSHYLTYDIDSGTFGTGNSSDSDGVNRFTVVLEQTGITSGSLVARRPDNPGSTETEAEWKTNSNYDIDINTTNSADYKLSATAPNSTTGPLDVYMVALDSHFGNNSDRYNKIAQVVFDREIVGILIGNNQTAKVSSSTGNVDLHNSNNSTYPNSVHSNRQFETIQWRSFQNTYSNGQWGYGTNTGGDWFAVGGTDNKTLHIAAKNTGGGDYARILVKGEVNNAPVARNDVGVIVEDGTLTVSDGVNANLSGSYDATGENSGDVLTTNSGSHADTDADSDTLVVSAVRLGGNEGGGTAGTLGQALTGIYGQLTLNDNGSYTYVANQDAADALDAGEPATDVFNYTVSDGNGGTDTALITITVLGANDAPVAQNDVGVIVENGTLIVSDGANANLSGDYDATGENSGDVLQTSSSSHKDNDADGDDPANLVVSAVRLGGNEGGGTAGTLGQALDGTYGQLTLNADGSYTYVANKDAADVLDAGETATDVFNYTVSDGNGGTDTATITITILGATDEPTSTNTTVYKEVKEEGKKKSKQDIRRERRQERKAERIAAKKFELPESSDKKFNQGLKLVDLVAESSSEDELSLKFKVFNDEGKEVQKYYGIMKDGSELPAWITVDSKTGKASTDIPKDIDLLEFKIIAVDTDNNKKQVTVIIDPEKISQDKDIMKQVNRKNSSNITVNNNGLVELNTTNEDGLTIKTATDAVNQNKSFKDIVNSIEANEEFKIQSESRDFNSDFIFKLENILEPNFDKIKLVLENGSDIPNWILFDEATGEITANPPAGIEALDFKIIIEDTDGVITVKDLEIDFMKNDNNTLLDIEGTEKNFVSFNQQLIIESDNLDNYGEKLINNL
ncbi:DUF4347 domain-containing protein [Candidatus Pelagibacter sp.]|nr:DUF4347 domain-containing protein [Candidatus Pelagibacter sp.]